MSYEQLPDAIQQQLKASEEEQKLQNPSNCTEKMQKIQTMLNKKKRTGKLDCVIVMDLTQSMDPYIEKMQKELCALIQEINENNKELDIQFGFIGYKDFCDDPDVKLQQFEAILKNHKINNPLEFKKLVTGHLSIQNFSKDLKKFQHFLMQMYAEGGGDIPEDVTGALHQALQLSWRTDSQKILILVADQPTHGNQYHELATHSDDYPKGHPFGIQLEGPLLK